jgi:ribose/xylose/arabinose/galactoside ABC-type transport system permease subunit
MDSLKLGSILSGGRPDLQSGAGSLRTSLLQPLRALLQTPMILVLLATVILFASLVDNFLSVGNLANMSWLFAPLAITAIGITFVFLIGGIDLSIGSVASFASVICAFVIRETDSILLGTLAAVAFGIGIGSVNGLAIAIFRLPAIVHTLGMLLTVRAVALLVTGGHSVGRLPIEVLKLGRGYTLGLPNLLWFAIVVAVASFAILRWTVFGREIFLIGSNKRAAIYTGLRVRHTEFLAYVTCSGLAALAGATIVFRLGSGGPVVGDNLLLTAIAAVVLGGTSIMGGEGGTTRTIIGAAVIVVLDMGLNRLGLSFYDQAIVMGMVIIVGSAFSMWIHNRRRRT